MKLTERCPRCDGTVIATIRLDQRADADTILARAVEIHADSCPTPAPITRRTHTDQVESAAHRDGDGTASTVRPPARPRGGPT